MPARLTIAPQNVPRDSDTVTVKAEPTEIKAERQEKIEAYFARFPAFDYSDSQEIMSQFMTLSQSQNWKKEERLEERASLQRAVVRQFNEIYGEDEASLEGWQELCRTMRIDPIPESVDECREVTSGRLQQAPWSLKRI